MKDYDKFEKYGKATRQATSRRASRSRHTGNISLTLEADYDDELAVRTSAIYDTAASNILGGVDAHSATSSEKPKQRSAAETEAFVAAIKLRDENTKRLNEGREKVSAANYAASKAEEATRQIAAALEKRGRSMGFDERVRERKKMLKAKAEAERLSALADVETQAFEQLKRDISTTMSDKDSTSSGGMGGGIVGASMMPAVGGVSMGSQSLVLWLVEVLEGDNIGKCYFGCCSSPDAPANR